MKPEGGMTVKNKNKLTSKDKKRGTYMGGRDCLEINCRRRESNGGDFS